MALIRESHPFEPFIPSGVEQLIVGSFPIGKFTNPDRRSEIDPTKEIQFFYGGASNLLWKLIGRCYEQKLDSKESIESLLSEKRIGVVDVIRSCERENGSASDNALKNIEFNPGMPQIIGAPSLRRLLFTSQVVQKWFSIQTDWRCGSHIAQVVLLSPSPQASRSIGRSEEFKLWKKSHPDGNTIDFRLQQYRTIFV